MAEQTQGNIIRLGVWTCWPDYLSLISSKLLTFAKYHSRLQVEILDDKDAMQTITKGTPEAKQELCKKLDGYDILISEPCLFGPFIYDLHHVQWIMNIWAGQDSLFLHVEDHRGPPHPLITRVDGGVFGKMMAGYVVHHMVEIERNMEQIRVAQRESRWMEEVSCRLVEDLSVCILGVGAIGLKVAEVLKSLGMTVYGMVSSIPKDKAVFVDQYFTMVQLPEFLKKSDYICNILPQTQETNSILDDGMLENCSANRSIFVNIGRGNVVQNDSIIEALDKGWIGGAVLDVFGEEPLPAESRLWSMPNVFITPHISGYKPELVFKSVLENLQLFMSGQELKYVVNLKRGY